MTRRAVVTLAAVALGAGVFVSGAKAAPPLCGSNQCAEEIAAACAGLSGADFRACKKFVLDQCKLSGETFCSCTNPALPPCPTCPPATAAYCGAADCGEGGMSSCDPLFNPLCPQGMTCTTTGTACGCTGDTIPCGDPRLSGLTCNFCKWGTCPPGMTCGGVPKSGACGFDCACH